MLHAGLDLSRRRLDICLLSDHGELVAETAAPPDADGLRGLADRVPRYRQPVRAVIESMNGARFVHDTLEELGWEVLIADAQKVKGLAPLACKTDKIDARVLAVLSQRDLVPAIWPPDPSIRRCAGSTPHRLSARGARSNPRRPANGARTMRLVGCGHAHRHHRILIVDPESRAPLRDGRVGEIMVSGPSVALGYWSRQQETRAAFATRPPGGGSAQRWLATGDLGFLLDRELFVCGRSKDLIVVAGRNLHPLDLELACEAAVPELRRGCGAAFAYERDGRERIGVVYELSGEASARPHDVVQAVRRAVARAVDAQVDVVVLVEPRTVPKTPSGKVQRGLCRSLFLEGRLDAVAEWSLAAATASDRPAPHRPGDS